MGSLGPEKILLIMVMVLLLFGAKRIPEVGASLGKGIKEFKKSLSGDESQPVVRDDSTSSAEAPRSDDGEGPRRLLS